MNEVSNGSGRNAIIGWGICILLMALYGLRTYQDSMYMIYRGGAESLIMARGISGEINFVEGSAFGMYLSKILTFLPRLKVFMGKILSQDLIAIEKGAILSTAFMAFMAVYLSGCAIGKNIWTGLLGALLLPLTWAKQMTIGYPLKIWDGIGGIGAWGMAASALIWSVWLLLRDSKRFQFLPHFLAGLVFNLHPTYGMILMGIFVLGDSYTAFVQRREDGPVLLRFVPILYGGLFFIIAALPLISKVVLNFGGSWEVASSELWWKIMMFRKTHHVFPWRNLETVYGVFVIAVIYALSALHCRGQVDAKVLQRIWVTWTAVIFMVLINIVLADLFKIEWMISLVLTRASFFLPLGAVLLISVLFIKRLRMQSSGGEGQDGTYGSMIFLIIPLILILRGTPVLSGTGIMIALLAPVYEKHRNIPAVLYAVLGALLIVSMVSFFGESLYGKMSALGRLSLLVCYAGAISYLAMLVYLSAGKTKQEGSLKTARAGAVCLLLFAVLGSLFFTVFKPIKAGNSKWNTPDMQAYFELAEWAKHNTPPDSLFLPPPYPGYFAGVSLRSTLMDAIDFGNSVYVRSMIDFEARALKIIYGIDLSQMTRNEAAELGENYHCEMEARYDDMLNNPGRIAAIRTEYPALTHLVGLKPGIGYPRRTCGEFTGKPLNLPVVYENNVYTVYDLKGSGVLR